jgi:hypothetical protein
MIRYKNPNKMPPNKEKRRYIRNTLLFAIPQTAIRAGSVVVGPTIRNARAAPSFIPRDNNPLITGRAVILLV